MSTPGASDTNGGNVKITLVGDGIVGKTCLLISYTQNRFPEEYVPTVFEHYGQNITVNGKDYNMTLWDTAGQEDYERLRPLGYQNTNCFLVCFSVDSSLASFDNVALKWVPELRHYNPHTPILLVATKIDLRDDPTIKSLTSADGNKMKRKVRAQGYVECSAKSREGLDQVFVQAINIYEKTKTKGRTRSCKLL